MNKPLSERLEAEAKLRRSCGQVHIVQLLDEAAALARRVEGAAVRNVVGQQWDDVFAREGNVVWCSDLNPGQRVALVPVEGGA